MFNNRTRNNERETLRDRKKKNESELEKDPYIKKKNE